MGILQVPCVCAPELTVSQLKLFLNLNWIGGLRKRERQGALRTEHVQVYIQAIDMNVLLAHIHIGQTGT